MVDGWSTLADRWAAMRPGGGRERFVSAETAASATTVFTIRWGSEVADLNAKDRIEYPIGSGRVFDIASVSELGRRVGLEIAAVTRGD